MSQIGKSADLPVAHCANMHILCLGTFMCPRRDPCQVSTPKGVPVPLSEHEQRLLEQMERALHAEDPRLSSALRTGSGRSINGRRIALGSITLLVGLGGLLGGVITSLAVLGVVGFLVMLGGVLVIGSALREPKPQPNDGAGSSASKSPRGKSKSTAGSSSFMSKVEERWRKRREGEGL